MSEPEQRSEGLPELLARAQGLRGAGRHEDAIAVAELVLERAAAASSSSPAGRSVQAGHAAFRATMLKAANLFDLGRAEDGLRIYDELVERWGEDPEPWVRAKLAEALAFKGHLLFRGPPGGGERAIAVFDELVARFGDADEVELREKVADAMRWKAEALQRIGRREAADGAYADLVAHFAGAREPTLRAQVAFALEHKTSNLIMLDRAEEALATCDELLAGFADGDSSELREVVARVLGTKAYLLEQAGREDEASVVNDALVARLEGEESPRLRVLLAELLMVAAAERFAQQEWEAALEAFGGVVRRFEDASDPALRGRVALALSNSVVALMQLGRPDEAIATHHDLAIGYGEDAIAVFDELASQYADAADPGQRRQAVGALVNKAGILRELDRGPEALVALGVLIARFADDDDEAILDFVGEAREHRAALLEDPGPADDG
jgi:tetratricopeptide (TPR) repeat protein